MSKQHPNDALRFTPDEVEQIAKAVGIAAPSPDMSELGRVIHGSGMEFVEAVLREAERILDDRAREVGR